MKISIFPNFGAKNSKEVFESFKKGAESLGHTVVEHDTSADMFVIWSVLWHGRMSQNKSLWNLAKKENKFLVILEVGCLSRGTTWKVGLNHINNLGNFANDIDLTKNRLEKLNLSLKPWKNSGKNILICGQHTKSEQWALRPEPNLWLSQLIDKIKSYSDRPIVFRPHPRDFSWYKSRDDVKLSLPKQISNTYDNFDHDRDFENAWCVVNPCSNTGILAAIQGIPVFVDPDSLAYPVANIDFSTLENPIKPDRNIWLEKISHTEWTIEEISQGIPIKRLTN